MTTSPTEQEIVARAIDEKEAAHHAGWTEFQKFYRGPEVEKRTGAVIAAIDAAISALDQYRAKNAGEVERSLRDRMKEHADDFHLEEYQAGYYCERCDDLDCQIDEADIQHHDDCPYVAMREAANLISSMRAVTQEKDRALDRIAKDLPQRGPQGFEDFSTAYSRIKHIARSTISDGVK